MKEEEKNLLQSNHMLIGKKGEFFSFNKMFNQTVLNHCRCYNYSFFILIEKFPPRQDNFLSSSV